MSTYVFDLESDGLNATKINCIVAKDIDTLNVYKYGPKEIREGLKLLYDADLIIGHNICSFDVPLIQRFFPQWEPKEMLDTLVFSRLLDPERQLHSLDSYGKQFKRYKPSHEDWSKFSYEMLYRCSEDVEINYILYRYLLSRAGEWDWSEAIRMEQEIARIHLDQVVAGVSIDVKHAVDTLVMIDAELEVLDTELMEKIPSHYVSPYNVPVNKPFLKSGEYSASVIKWYEEVI